MTEQEGPGERVVLEGYLTTVSRALGEGDELYLHVGERVYRVVSGGHEGDSIDDALDQLPRGPRHRLRLSGLLMGDRELPSLEVEWVESRGRRES